MTRDEFLKMAIEAARASSAESKLPAGITVAQAALESAWGKSGLSRQGNNYFGIKAHGKHFTVEMPTTEVFDGEGRRKTARFAAYADMLQCFADRDRLIRTSAFYTEARAKASDPEAFVRALAKHWATDPNYADKLLRIYRENNLDELDREGEGSLDACGAHETNSAPGS